MYIAKTRWIDGQNNKRQNDNQIKCIFRFALKIDKSNVALDIYFIKNTQLMHHIRKVTISKNTYWVSCVQSAYSRFYSGLCGFLWSSRLRIWFFTQPEYNDATVAKENYLLTGGNLEEHSTCCLTWLFFKLAPLWCYCIRC